MTTKHQQEPWSGIDATEDHSANVILDKAGAIVGSALDIEAARRIVACVNACEGISDDALDSWMNPPEGGYGHPDGPWPVHLVSLEKTAETLKQQRDNLLEATLALLEFFDHPDLPEAREANRHALEVVETIMDKVEDSPFLTGEMK